MSKELGPGVPRFSCDQAQDLLGAFALDSLEAVEAAGIRDHLRGCDACRQEAEELRAAAMQIGESIEPVNPSPGLRARILEEVRPAAIGPVAEAGGRGPQAVPWWSATRIPWAIAAAAAILMLAAGGWGLEQHLGPARPGSTAVVASTTLTPVDRLIASGDATILPLTATSSSSARGALITDPVTGATYLLLSGVPRLGPNRAYTLWYIGLKHGNLEPIAIGDMTRAGAYRMPRSPRGFVKIALTREPGPHDTTPRGPVLLTASLA